MDAEHFCKNDFGDSTVPSMLVGVYASIDIGLGVTPSPAFLNWSMLSRKTKDDIESLENKEMEEIDQNEDTKDSKSSSSNQSLLSNHTAKNLRKLTKEQAKECAKQGQADVGQAFTQTSYTNRALSLAKRAVHACPSSPLTWIALSRAATACFLSDPRCGASSLNAKAIQAVCDATESVLEKCRTETETNLGFNLVTPLTSKFVFPVTIMQENYMRRALQEVKQNIGLQFAEFQSSEVNEVNHDFDFFFDDSKM